MGERMIIVGGGIAGLSTGIFAQRNGFDSLILEKNSEPGGLCTAWQREGYTIDGCTHWLLGCQPGSAFYRAWQAVGVDLSDAIRYEEFYRLQDGDKELIWHADLDELKQELLRDAPEDQTRIEHLLEDARAFADVELEIEQPKDLMDWKDGLQNLWSMRSSLRLLRRYQNTTVEEHCARLENTWVRRLLTRGITGHYSMLALLSTLAGLHNRDVGFPRGGSKRLAADMAACYFDQGGELRLDTQVIEILVENDRAVGVRLADGTIERADHVVSAVDAHHLYYELLASQTPPSFVESNFRQLPTFTSCQVSFGLDIDLSHRPQALYWRLPAPINLAGIEHKNMNVRHYCMDPTLEPKGHSVTASTIFADYDRWKTLAMDPTSYAKAKQALADQVQAFLEEKYPEIRGHVRMVDVVTPVTYQRWAGSWQGSYMGWAIGPKHGDVDLPWEHPKLGQLYMVGQWSDAMAGLPGSMLTGRYLIQRLCRRSQTPFSAE